LSERLNLIHKLCESIDSRTSYIKAKLGVLVPSQIKALRINSEMPRQSDLARVAGLHQSRISMFETPGAANLTLETLARLAAAFKVGLIVKFVPFSEMLRSENEYSQDSFCVTPIDKDYEFLDPATVTERENDHASASQFNGTWMGLSEGASQLGNPALQGERQLDQKRPSLSCVTTQIGQPEEMVRIA
jgi:transcriptional regulator with XRE-family HTH domain